jgi:glycosyltransferase involved in cell wall biosynthesis
LYEFEPAIVIDPLSKTNIEIALLGKFLSRYLMLTDACIIGSKLTNKYLQPRQKEFKALIDFKRKNYLPERKIQIQILKKLNIPFTILSKRYKYSEICKIYSEHSIYFLAHRESFGLPIVELQNCGCYIFTPHKRWAPSHYINKSIYSRGEGNLNNNFIVYNNDPDQLEKKIVEIKSNYLAKKVVKEFIKKNSNLYKGNLNNLSIFIKKLKSKKINYTSHQNYKKLEKHLLG